MRYLQQADVDKNKWSEVSQKQLINNIKQENCILKARN